MPDPTTNFGWDVPVDGGDVGVWGQILNQVFDDIDTDLNTVKQTAEAAFASGGAGPVNVAGIVDAWAVITKHYDSKDATFAFDPTVSGPALTGSSIASNTVYNVISTNLPSNRAVMIPFYLTRTGSNSTPTVKIQLDGTDVLTFADLFQTASSPVTAYSSTAHGVLLLFKVASTAFLKVLIKDTGAT